MREKVLASAFLFFSVNSFSYQLPDANGVLGQCNNYSNREATKFIKDNNIIFRNELDAGSEKKEVPGFNVMGFYSSISAACNVAHTMALHGTPAPNAIPMAAGSVKSTILSTSDNITEEMADKILYQAAIYGYSL